MKKATDFSPLTYLVWVGQLGLSLVLPIVLCVYGAVWLSNRFHLGGWTVFVGLAFGLGVAFISLYRFFGIIQKAAEQKKENQRDRRDEYR